MRPGYEPDGPLEGFTEPVPFVSENLDGIVDGPGVHMVWGPDGSPLYVGMTGRQRERLRMHLTGDREASVLHKKIGHRLDVEFGREATRDEIRDWLGTCDVAWAPSEDRQRLKSRIMEELQPELNEVKPVIDEAMVERSPWDAFMDWARVFYEEPEFDSIERDYKIHLGREVRVAREALSGGGDWWEPLNAAFHSGNNNLTRWNQHNTYLDWAQDHQEEAARGLAIIWDSALPLTERIRGFADSFPTDVFSGYGMRTSIASILLLGDDPTQYPPYKPTVFNDGQRLVAYPSLPTSADEAEIYEHALSFLDRIMEEAAERGWSLRDHLDAQAVLWSVLKNGLNDSATERQRKALAAYRRELRPAWWVNQGATYAQERAGHYAWAPQQTKGGFPVKHHTDVLQARRGDTVLHYSKGAIRAIGLVTKSGYRADRPSSLPEEAWQTEGFRANVRYFDLDDPIKLTEIPVSAREEENTAFTTQGSVKQGYLYGLSQEFSDELREHFVDRWPAGSPWYQREPNYWLFQARPDVTDLADLVATREEGDGVNWIVTRYREELEVGDVILLWQSGSNSGIYAIAEIAGEPLEGAHGENLIVDPNRTEWTINMKLLDASMSPILRPDLLEHPILKDLAVIKNAQGTNFKVTREQWTALQDLIHDVRTLAVAVEDEAAFEEVRAGRYGWDTWHTDYNIVGKGDRVVFAVVDGVERLEAVVSSDGVYQATDNPPYRVDLASVSKVSGPMSPEIEEAMIRSSLEGGRGVLVGEPPIPDNAGSLEDVVLAFSEAVRSSNLDYGQRHDDLIRAFTVSLATKGFVLLTGLSGSGKTRLAMAFGQWLGEGRYQVEAVRPDWTGPDALLGYEDGLSERKENGQAWHVPQSLEFMLRAAHDPHRAYLLVLDEMNLAHVERYFADVLSGMESGEPILPNLARDDAGEWRLIADKDERIPFPPNLFIAGTVNIDETTYMFSPKVLDRANTLEFRVRTEDLIVHAQPPDDVAPGADGLAASFLDAAQLSTEAWGGTEELARYLQGLHRILSLEDREFGHRVFFEAQRFGALLAEAGDDNVLAALDLQVMQKILPRFHGSLRQLARPLATIGEWAYRLESSEDVFDPLGDSIKPDEAKLAISFDKIRRMTRRLRANHFVSFAE